MSGAADFRVEVVNCANVCALARSELVYHVTFVSYRISEIRIQVLEEYVANRRRKQLLCNMH